MLWAFLFAFSESVGRSGHLKVALDTTRVETLDPCPSEQSTLAQHSINDCCCLLAVAVLGLLVCFFARQPEGPK